MLHYDAILFDVDGTLIDSAPGILHTLEEVFQKMGVDVTGVNLRRYLGPPLRKSFGEHFTELDKILRWDLQQIQFFFLRSYFFRSFSFQMRYKSNTLLVITIENHKSFEVTKYFF